MKITILDISPDEEDEIIIKCHSMSDDVNNLICRLKQGKRKIAGYDKNVICMLDAEEIYYFDTIDNRVFAYCSKDVYEVKEKLYQLEEFLVSYHFMRASKSMVLNLNKIKHLSPAFGGRFEALLENDEKVIISRQYVPVLKERLGL
ncbi:MAG: LytTR family transcriptional regulator [Lachnospira sp.]|nr:LytTR family transcriptional regulator [Lachnospira sp.]MDD5828933.1 LytTR family DNA-binding domain-containing protein [Lachnospira sp.]